MTFREKLIQEHPELAAKKISMVGCPFDFGFEAAYNCEDPTCRSHPCCRDCWNREMPGNSNVTFLPYKPNDIAYGQIKDSGERRQFETGAVRDIQEGKGRCDLMPLRVAAKVIDGDPILDYIGLFLDTGDTQHLYFALRTAARMFNGLADMLLEVAKHFEEGAKKYGENNWQKGLPVNCYIDSAVRHYLKWLRGDKDEPHDRAFVWNLMCCIWEVDFSPRAKERDQS